VTGDQIRQVVLDQRDELLVPPPSGAWIRRTLERDLRAALARPLVKVITGARRAGKSVLARLALGDREYAYVNFDDERLSALTAADLQHLQSAFASLWPAARIVFLDEVQNVDGWELFVNRLQRLGYNLVITGSNSRLLSRDLATHPTGRYVAIELFPFSFAEFLDARRSPRPTTTAERGRVRALLDVYAREGGFPESVLFGYSGPYLRELHDKIVTRDIAARYHVEHHRTLKELSLYCFSNPATRVTYNSVQRTFAFRSVHTAKSYLHFLEEASLVFLVVPFAFKVREQIRQARTLYTIDNGLTSALSTKVTDDRGARLENLVFQELRRRGHDIFTWSQPDGEVDFAIREGRRVVRLIQVCAALDTAETCRASTGPVRRPRAPRAAATCSSSPPTAPAPAGARPARADGGGASGLGVVAHARLSPRPGRQPTPVPVPPGAGQVSSGRARVRHR
jgi:hypothetical protein